MSLKAVWLGSLTLSLALVLACGGAATPAEPQVVEVTRVVTEQVEVEKQVEVERQVEVTREVLVVATPVPPVQGVVRQQGDPTGTLTVSLQNLGSQVTDPILQGRAGHAQYQAPIYDALLGFNHGSQYGGVGPGVAEEWGIDPDGTRGCRQKSLLQIITARSWQMARYDAALLA